MIIKITKKILLLLLATLIYQNGVVAQGTADHRTLTTKIADLLAQLPALDAAQLTSNMQEISQMGEDGYVTLITSLTAPGTGNNAAVEYAIGGFSNYVNQPGKEAERKMCVSAYANALGKLKDPQNKAFIITQLGMVGKDDAIPYLQNFLNNQELVDPAARALVKINSAASKAALLANLEGTVGNAKLSIIQALGDSRYKDAAAKLNVLSASQDQAIAAVSLNALSQLADPSSEKVMREAAEKSKYKYENTNAVVANLNYAMQLSKDGNQILASKVAKQLSDKAINDDQVHLRIAALKVLNDADQNKSTPLLLKAVNDKNIVYRTAALKFAAPFVTPATSGLWVKKLNKADAVNKAELIDMLGNARSKEALPVILKQLKNKDQGVRLAAIDAAAKIGQEQVLDDLIKVMPKSDSTEMYALTAALERLKGEEVTPRIAAHILKSKPKVQIALIRVLAYRAANAQLNTITVLLKNRNPEVRKTAFKALPFMVVTENLPLLDTLLNETSDSLELIAVQDAMISALKGTSDTSVQVDALLKQMNVAPASKKILFYKILASLGGDQALEVVSTAYNTGNELTKKSALNALATWTDAGSMRELIRISRETKNVMELDTALKGYLILVEKSGYTPQQQLLKLREAMTIARTPEQQNQILSRVGQAKSFNSLVFAGGYLDNPALQQTAAHAVMNIALADLSYTGSTVKDLLSKTILVLKGNDSEYEKEALRKYLREMSPEEGFVSLFNGKDLEGWKGLVGDPIKRAAMSSKTLAALQEKANAEMKESWKVVNGELQFASKGNNIATIKKYGDFEMLIDWKIIDDKKQQGDAGIYLRGTPQVQIWDNARVKDGAQVGSGGLYNNQVNENKPLVVADNKLDEWNTFRILMVGDRVTVHLNGKLVTDNVILENYWDRNLSIFPEEQIELQAHGSPVAYRSIFIREIPRQQPFKLSAAEKKEGYQVLFDGSNMYNWTGNTTDYIIENGNIAIRPKPGKGSGGNLFTKKEYSDFIFRFEFQLTPGANNGLGIRAPLEGDAAYTGMELQILDNDAPMYKDLNIYQYHGSIYGTIPAKRGYLKPVGEWNYEEVYVKGPKIEVILNGTSILDADITDARKNGAADGEKHPGLMRDSGHIGFLGHGSPVQFRNIRIKDLSTAVKK
jgi:HEAT repeat protein